MDEDTTTTENVTPDAGAEALPVEENVSTVAEETPASEPSEESQDAPAEEQPSAPEVDDKLQKYAASQGLELDSPSAIKAAGIAMKAQSEATRNYQKASEIEKTMTNMSDTSAEATAESTGQDPEILKRLQRQEVKGSIRDFFDNNPGARQYETEMSEIAQTAGLYGTPEAILKASYAMAVANNPASVKSQAKRETLTALAHKQQAAVPRGHATTNATPAKKSFKDMSISEMEAHLGTVRQ